jgi:hypothetical protein
VVIRTYAAVSRSFVRSLQLELLFRQQKLQKIAVEEDARRRYKLQNAEGGEREREREREREEELGDSFLQCCSSCLECRKILCDVSYSYESSLWSRVDEEERDGEMEKDRRSLRCCCRHRLSLSSRPHFFEAQENIIEWLDVICDGERVGGERGLLNAHVVMVYVPRMQKLWSYLRSLPGLSRLPLPLSLDSSLYYFFI